MILLLALLGVGAWALSLRSDNEDKDSTIASQEQQLQEQQGAAENAQDAASGFAEDVQQTLSGLGDQLDEIQGAAVETQEDVADRDRSGRGGGRRRARQGRDRR